MLLVRWTKEGLPLARKMPPGSNNTPQEAPQSSVDCTWREAGARAGAGDAMAAGTHEDEPDSGRGCGHLGPGPRLGQQKGARPRCTAPPARASSSCQAPAPRAPGSLQQVGGEPLPLPRGISSREGEGAPGTRRGHHGLVPQSSQILSQTTHPRVSWRYLS